MLEGRCALESVRCAVAAAGQADLGVGLGEDVDAVDLDARGAVEAGALGLRRSLDKMASQADVAALLRNNAEPFVRDLPVRAVLEVEQRDVHGRHVKP